MLGDAPDIHCLPVGNAGNITAYWQGYREYAADGIATSTPADVGLPGRRRRADRRGPRRARTRAPSPPRSGSATRRPGPRRSTARDESGGLIDAVTDEQILAAYRLLARYGGGVRRAGVRGQSVAGLLQVAEAGELPAGSTVVCTVTGNGLKDPEWAISGAPAPVTVPVDAAAAAAQLGL